MKSAQLTCEELLLENEKLKIERDLLKQHFQESDLVELLAEQKIDNNRLMDLNRTLTTENVELNNGEPKLRAVFDILDVGITITNSEGHIVDCNLASEKILGVTKEEHLSRNYTGKEWDIVRPDKTKMPSEEYASVRAMRENKAIKHVVMGVVRQNTQITWISVNALPLDIEGYGVVVTYYDITASVRAKAQLLASEIKFRHAIDSSPIPISLHKDTGEFIHLNKQFITLFGYSEQEVTKFSNWIELAFPNSEYRKQVAKVWSDYIINGNYNEELEREELIITCSDGEQRTILMGFKKSNDFIIATYNDITERKRIEVDLEKHRDLLDHNEQIIKVGGWLYTLATNEMHTTKGLIDLKAFEFIGSFDPTFTSLKYYSVSSKDDLKNAFQSSIESEECSDIECDLDINGTHKMVNVKMCPIYNKGKVTQVIGSVIDITNQKRIELELRSLNATKDKFFSIIAHDLKSPFNAIMGFSDLILEKVRMGDYQMVAKYSEVVLTSATQAFNLLDNLLSWSRAQTGRIEFSPHPLVLKLLLDEVIRLFHSNIQRKRIKLLLAISPDLAIEADKFMLETILRNLISNAIKFTNEGGEIHICALFVGNQLEVSIIDSGVGIQASRINKLFHIGESSSTLGTEKEKGTGLGLILSHEFATLHKGKLSVSSTEGEGSTFRLTLPRYSPLEN